MNDLLIGGRLNTPATKYFVGEIDEVFFFVYLLSAAEITQIRNQRAYIPSDSSIVVTIPPLLDLPKAPSEKDLSVSVMNDGGSPLTAGGVGSPARARGVEASRAFV